MISYNSASALFVPCLVPCLASYLAVFLLSGAPALHAFGPTRSILPRIQDERLDSALARTARGLIRKNIAPYSDGLVHRPKSEEPGDAVSEGQAYGMMVALYSDDQPTFDKVWDAAERHMWNGSTRLYDWRVGAKGGIIGTGMATDADQDIALMLLFADSLARKGVWKPHTGPKGANYRQRAMEIINSIWSGAVVEGRYLAPGAGWGGKEFVNPSYFSPANYRIFAKVDPGHNWNAVIDQCYATVFANPGASKGLLPDWMTPGGGFFEGSLGYNAFRSGKSHYKDAIRVHWRMAMDWLWFGEPRAKRFMESANAFIQSPDRADFYTLEGERFPASEKFTLGDGETRSRREHSELTVGMWACAAFSVQGPTASKPWSDKLLSFLPAGSDMWGLPADMSLPDRTGSTPNEEYFEQYLAWFGAAVLAGRFSNIWEDLKNPPATGIAGKRAQSAPDGALERPRLITFTDGAAKVRTSPGANVLWIGLDGKTRAVTRADRTGMAGWKPAGTASGMIFVKPERASPPDAALSP